MNKARRASLKEVLGLLDRSIDIIRSVRDDEQQCIDNTPENLQGSDRYELMETVVDNLEDAIDKINEAKECIDESI